VDDRGQAFGDHGDRCVATLDVGPPTIARPEGRPVRTRKFIRSAGTARTAGCGRVREPRRLMSSCMELVASGVTRRSGRGSTRSARSPAPWPPAPSRGPMRLASEPPLVRVPVEPATNPPPRQTQETTGPVRFGRGGQARTSQAGDVSGLKHDVRRSPPERPHRLTRSRNT
jgi:hypothetical protein